MCENFKLTHYQLLAAGMDFEQAAFVIWNIDRIFPPGRLSPFTGAMVNGISYTELVELVAAEFCRKQWISQQ